MMRLTRTYRFAASHRLHSDRLNEDQNRDLYGKCNNPYGHGHDYILRITVGGDVNPQSGRLVAPGKLDRYVCERVVDALDHKDLNTDVPDLEGVPTTENLARYVERQLREAWSTQFSQVTLESVWIRETARNTIELRSR